MSETVRTRALPMMDYDEYADEEWIEDTEDGDELLACPSCHEAVHEDTQQCPHCGDWITPQYASDRWQRPLIVVVVLLLITGLLMMAVF